MPIQKRHPTKYPGVYYIIGTSVATGKPEKIFYIDYRKDGKRIQEKAGRQSQDWTPARAARKRSDKIKGQILSNKEQREAEEAAKKTEENKWTIDRLWSEYKAGRNPGKGLATDVSRYKKYIKTPFGDKEPHEIQSLDVERLKRRLLKEKSPQTVKHVLNLFTWIINFGVKSGLCSGLTFHVQKPTVNNIVTEYLTTEQLKRLLVAIDADKNRQVANLMKLALFTGMRRGELFKLQWKDIDFDNGFINIRDPKGGKDQIIPMSQAARELLESHEKGNSSFVFPGQGGKHRVTAQKGTNRIKKRAGLPRNFRPLHGLRHVFASQLASSGRVDMYVLQRLLTHKDPRMTQRYAHLRDETLKRASDLAGEIITEAQSDKDKVVEMTMPNDRDGNR